MRWLLAFAVLVALCLLAGWWEERRHERRKDRGGKR